ATAPAAVVEPTSYRAGNLEVDWPARVVRVDGEVVGLTKLEFQLLQTFVRHPGQALSTQQLLEQVWNDPFGIGPERVKFTVLRLRRKLGWQDEYKDVLEAIRGYGYRYTPVGDRSPG
ncbi:MAG TPA: winged helix-turn-helix domain-containing protein, partial [Acidimicrobiales bacterium]